MTHKLWKSSKLGNHFLNLQLFLLWHQLPLSQSITIIKSCIEYCCSTYNHKLCYNNNQKTLRSAQKETLSLILRPLKLTSSSLLEAELNKKQMKIDIWLQELVSIQCLKIMWHFPHLCRTCLNKVKKTLIFSQVKQM